MQSIDSIWQVGILALLAGIMIGLLGYRLFGRSTREGDKVRAELDAARDELASYRASVNEHFDKTSELVNDLTQNYVRVYQHLAEGATTLGDGRTFNNLIERHPGKVSLTVDGETRPSASDYDASVVEAAAPAEVPPVSPDITAETPAKVPPAEPASVTETAADDPAAATEAHTPPAAAADEPAQKADVPEPGANAGALDESSDKKSAGSTADAASVMPEDDEKTSRTVH